MPAPSHLLTRSAVAWLAVTGLLVGACSTVSPSEPSVAPTSAAAMPSPASIVSDVALSGAYRGELTATIRVPEAPGPATLIVVVPGGGWSTADPAYVEAFAESLTAAGNTTSLITYSTTWDGARFPQPADDVACAVRWSAVNAADLGYPPARVVVAGHSAGGHLATLVALSGDEFGGDCEWPPVKIDGVVGMSGVYDSTSAIGGLDELFEGNDSDATRSLGSPIEWADSDTATSSGVRVLLLHGDGDKVVPLKQAKQLASALTSAGVDVQLTVLPGEGHDIPTTSEDVVPTIEKWLAAD